MSGTVESHHAIILLGDSRRRRLAQALEQSLDDWRQRWGGNHQSSFEVEIAESLCRRPASIGNRHLAFSADDATGHLLVAAVPVEMQSELLAVGASRITIEGAGEIANAVFIEAMHALCLRLVRAGSVENVNVTGLSGDGLGHAWQQYGLTVTVKNVDRVLLRMRLSPRLVLAMLPSQASKLTEALASRRTAISSEPVDVQAWLGEAEVTLGELAQLQVGEVILLDTSMTGTGQLALPDGRPLAPVRLGSAAGHRAVSVVGHTAGQSGR